MWLPVNLYGQKTETEIRQADRVILGPCRFPERKQVGEDGLPVVLDGRGEPAVTNELRRGKKLYRIGLRGSRNGRSWPTVRSED